MSNDYFNFTIEELDAMLRNPTHQDRAKKLEDRAKNGRTVEERSSAKGRLENCVYTKVAEEIARRKREGE